MPFLSQKWLLQRNFFYRNPVNLYLHYCADDGRMQRSASNVSFGVLASNPQNDPPMRVAHCGSVRSPKAQPLYAPSVPTGVWEADRLLTPVKCSTRVAGRACFFVNPYVSPHTYICSYIVVAYRVKCAYLRQPKKLELERSKSVTKSLIGWLQISAKNTKR